MLSKLLARLADVPLDAGLLQFRDNDELAAHLAALTIGEVCEIGASRSGQAMYGVVFGNGRRNVSLIAGCHADEPIGPMTAQALPVLLQTHFPELLDEYRLYVVPQMNPDGADVNRAWFADPPDPARYLAQVSRELPGDDIEFNFGEAADVRPENRAAMEFLRPHAPFAAHFSLHGLAIATGAWCLINRVWRDRAAGFMDAFSAFCRKVGYPQHDEERNGEKGFERIRPGFCTTPRSDAMRTFFEAHGDHATASRFHPNSMEWIASLGGDPLCIVSEVPLFTITPPEGTSQHAATAAVKDALRSAAMGGDVALAEIVERYSIRPTPISLQVRLQLAMIVLALQ